MSNSLKSSIIDALGFAIGYIIVYSIIYKLILDREDGYYFCIVWCISWTAGRFVSKSIDTFETNIRFIISCILIIMIACFLGALILSVLLEITQWKYILLGIICQFGLGAVVSKLFEKISIN